MKYKYFKKSNYLIVEKKYNKQYLLRNFLTEQVFLLSENDYHFLNYLNGKRAPFSYPHLSENEIQSALDKFFEHELIRNSNKLAFGYYTLFIPKMKRSKNIGFKKWNQLLLISFLPVFFTGFYLYYYTMNGLVLSELSYTGWFVGIIFGLLLHECSHACAGLSYGARLFEAGIMLFPMPGAYVLMDTSLVKNRLKRIQAFAAGVEMNILLSGIGWIAATTFSSCADFFSSFAFINFFLGVLNLLISGGLDGERVLTEIIGISPEQAYSLILGRVENKHAKLHPVSGKISLIMSLILFLGQIVAPLVTLTSILSFF